MMAKILFVMKLGTYIKCYQYKEHIMIKFLKNYGVYIFEALFLIILFGFAYFLLMLF